MKYIYNANEFGLFYQVLSDKFLHYKGERCSGGKHSKVRLPRLATGKAMGEKLATFVIAKFTKPRCFSGIKSFPCHYCAQKHSWMDGNLFTEWVKELHRKIAIIIANCPMQPKVDDLKALELIFLPPKITSKTKPMDYSNIKSLKSYYCHSLIKCNITSINGGR